MHDDVGRAQAGLTGRRVILLPLMTPAETPEHLGRTFAWIVIVEIATLAALYVFSRHFALP